MIKVIEAIQEYEENKISLEELQDYLWGLSEDTFELLSSKQIGQYLFL